MKNKKIFIAIGIIFFIIILALIIVVLKKPKNNNEDITVQTNKEEKTVQASKEEREGDKEGKAYSDESLLNFSFEIKGATDDLNSKIENKDDFYLALKRYAYGKGLVTANEATVKKYKQEDNTIKIRFQLNNTEETRIIAIINTTNNEYEFYYY